jgi:hypothetical protein
LLSDRHRPRALIAHLGLGLIALAVVQSRACFEPSVNPQDERLLRFDAMDGKSRPQLPPPFLGEDASVTHVFAAAIYSPGAKRKTQFERRAVALNILNSQRIIQVGMSFGASVP